MNWKWHAASATLSAVVVSLLMWPLLLSFASVQVAPFVPDMRANVVVTTAMGKGSGVHIGDGYVLTAAHVVGSFKTVTFTYYGGGDQKADVLWSNPDYDIALVHVDRKRWDQSAPLDCAPNYIGQRVSLVGNPMFLDFVYTSGTVAGDPMQMGGKEVVPLDATLVFGQSGGGVIDQYGHTVGIAVSVMSLQPAGLPAIAPIGFMVGADTVCELMARS